MNKTTLHARTGVLPAIAAVLALSSTAAFAQEAQPVPTDSAPVAVSPPTTSEVPAAEESLAPTPDTADTTASSSADAPVKAKKPVRSTARSVPAKVASSTNGVRSASAPVASAAVAATSTVKPAPASPVEATTATAPVAEPVAAAEPAPPPTETAATAPVTNDRTWPIVGGALTLLALGGVAFAMNRRRRDEVELVEDYADDQALVDEPVIVPVAAQPVASTIYDEQPAIVAPSAFTWNNQQEQATVDEPDDRNPGESWMDRAHRGPSAGNPSVSLRNRLKRAAFFDKRERDAAAGKSEPVDPTAGLPEAMLEEQNNEVA